MSTAANSSNTKSVVATCPSGKRVVGGGARATGSGAPKVTVNESFPDSSGDKWNGNAAEVVATNLTWNLQAFALCAKVS